MSIWEEKLNKLQTKAVVRDPCAGELAMDGTGTDVALGEAETPAGSTGPGAAVAACGCGCCCCGACFLREKLWAARAWTQFVRVESWAAPDLLFSLLLTLLGMRLLNGILLSHHLAFPFQLRIVGVILRAVASRSSFGTTERNQPCAWRLPKPRHPRPLVLPEERK